MEHICLFSFATFICFNFANIMFMEIKYMFAAARIF